MPALHSRAQWPAPLLSSFAPPARCSGVRKVACGCKPRREGRANCARPIEALRAHERTLRFCQAMGFVALEEFLELWGPENPALFIAKTVGQSPSAGP